MPLSRTRPETTRSQRSRSGHTGQAALTGFQTAIRNAVTLEARQVARLDFKMGVGALEEVVEVAGTAPILQTETPTVGEVISGNTVASLPLNGRNTGQLALLLPGTMTYNPRGFTNIGSINMARPNVNGNRDQTNSFTVDGFDVNETIDNRVAYQPSPDAIAEISVETNNYSADVGNVGGAVISNVVKSGTNRFRGNAFEFYRNSDFDANTWENNRSGARKPERVQHIYGGTFGGPIARGTLFFFADYQGSRQDSPGSGTASVAPESWRRGDLSGVNVVIRDPLTLVPFPNNQIPENRISPIARAILSNAANYPLPNRTVPGGVTGNYVGETLSATRAHQGDARLDFNPSANDRFSDTTSGDSTRATTDCLDSFSTTAPSVALRSLTSCSTRWRARDGAAVTARPRGRTCRIGRHCSSRMTSRWHRTSL